MFKKKETLKEDRILLADDEVPVRNVMEMLLRNIGRYQHIDVASTGTDALDMLLMKPYDLMITDTHMPGLKGYEVIQHYRLSPNANGTRFLGTSGYDEREVYASLGVPFIKKPFDCKEFFSVVYGVLNK
ncbi:response regulator [Candidatus Woesearchaeota archaeon]|nr:response regulator [Candidatus Woesearchaeota archaeon]